jgi:nucleic acid/nucleotide deaminase of polymorphic system toxin
MLQLFHQLKDKEPHWYIGCSKLSCHFCSRILENGKKHGQRYHTKGGHYKISQNCVFPFSLFDKSGYISEALSTVQYEMLHSILRYATAIKDEFTMYSVKDDTVQGRTGDGSNAVSFRSNAIQKEELLNWTRLQNPRPPRTPFGLDSVKALKLRSDGKESFEIVQIVRKDGSHSNSIFVQADIEHGTGIPELSECSTWDAIPFNQDTGTRKEASPYSTGHA